MTHKRLDEYKREAKCHWCESANVKKDVFGRLGERTTKLSCLDCGKDRAWTEKTERAEG